MNRELTIALLLAVTGCCSSTHTPRAGDVQSWVRQELPEPASLEQALSFVRRHGFTLTDRDAHTYVYERQSGECGFVYYATSITLVCDERDAIKEIRVSEHKGTARVPQ